MWPQRSPSSDVQEEQTSPADPSPRTSNTPLSFENDVCYPCLLP